MGCGEETAPLALDQRILTESELPGFKFAPSPVQRWTDATKFAKGTHDQDIRTTVEENIEQLQAGGFVAAIANSLGGLGPGSGGILSRLRAGSPCGDPANRLAPAALAELLDEELSSAAADDWRRGLALGDSLKDEDMTRPGMIR